MSPDRRWLNPFPTRRSSDLATATTPDGKSPAGPSGSAGNPISSDQLTGKSFGGGSIVGVDRKSTRLNSSHVEISYAVFCLKKKNQKSRNPRPGGVKMRRVYS